MQRNRVTSAIAVSCFPCERDDTALPQRERWGGGGSRAKAGEREDETRGTSKGNEEGRGGLQLSRSTLHFQRSRD